MPVVTSGGLAGFGYALLALVIGVLAFIGVYYIPVYLNSRLVSMGLPALIPTIPDNFLASIVVAAVAFVLMFLLLSGRRQYVVQPVIGRRQ